MIRKHIQSEWGVAAVNAFDKKTINFLRLLAVFPEIGVIEVREKAIRSFQLTKQTRVFYRVKGHQIIVIAFFDVRRDPLRKP